MVIVHVVEPFATGIAVFVKSLTEAMPDDTHIIIHGERKDVMTAEMVKKSFHSKNVRFIKWHSAQRSITPAKDIFAFSELYTILRRLNQKKLVDAVHLHSSKSGLLGRLACRMAGIKNVFYTPNGASFLSANYKVTRYFYQQLEKIGNRLGGKVICCSPSELEEYLRLGINAEYVNNGVEVDNKRHQVSIKTDKKFRIVTSGRIETQKNPDLFNAVASYFEDMDQIEFMWIGNGPGEKALTAKNIAVTGWLDRKKVHEYLATSDIYLSTSKYEGLSFAVLEALALKKPVLLSNCTGNIDLVKRGINGSLFSTQADATVKILRYYSNREMLPLMGEYSKEICKTEFDGKQNFKIYREIYAGSLNEMNKGTKWSFTY